MTGAAARGGAARVVHPLAPIESPDARVLLLGTMPSPASRAAGFYYGHPRNRFWPVIARLFGEVDPRDNAGRAALARRHGIAIWDVLASCEIVGASDASIRDPVPNDIAALLRRTSVRTICTTGSTAWRLYHRLCEPATGVPATRLPSTSPANAAWCLDDLVRAYEVVRACAIP